MDKQVEVWHSFFEHDIRYTMLESEMENYYNLSDKYGKKVQKDLNKVLKQWIDSCGYTSQEVHSAKERVLLRIGKPLRCVI
jgi:hypothetical protein